VEPEAFGIPPNQINKPMWDLAVRDRLRGLSRLEPKLIAYLVVLSLLIAHFHCLLQKKDLTKPVLTICYKYSLI
jgi:hypothetical protein